MTALPDGPILVHRCTVCGKWSHAADKPKFHQRFVRDEGQLKPDPQLVISYEQGIYSHLLGDESPSGWWVRCGPFQSYRAEPIITTPKETP